MSQRAERITVAASIAVIVLAAVIGALVAPTTNLGDRRPSTFLAGPFGAKGLARTLERLGLEVEQRRQPYFTLSDSTSPDPTHVLAFIAPGRTSGLANAVLRDYVWHGGRLFIAGSARASGCFGYQSVRLQSGSFESRVATRGATKLPGTERVLERFSVRGDSALDLGCTPRSPAHVDTLLRTVVGKPVALRLRWNGTGTVTLLADSRYLTNRVLKETDAGIVVIPWLLERGTRRVVFDEYDLGFGTGGSLASVSWDWLLSHPLGWALLQLAGVAILAMIVRALRFGPPQSVRNRRRRSPLEHVGALAAGLESARGFDAGVQLLVRGLRRRLSPDRTATIDDVHWLARLNESMISPGAHGAVERLEAAMQRPKGEERLVETAQAVEDIWAATRAAS